MHAERISLNVVGRLSGQCLGRLDQEYKHLPFAGHALQKLVRDYEFSSVLDLGCGQGLHADVLLAHGKDVTAFDYGESVYFRKRSGALKAALIGDFNCYNFDSTYDCVWCSHVLEHQLNPNDFLQRIRSILKIGGILAITVPPMKREVVGGHLTLWNAGLLLYNLVLAGFDCSGAAVARYGYNISVIVKHKPTGKITLAFDSGDVETIMPFLPKGLNMVNRDRFDGEIYSLNWK
jgi:SAM-dependent methyltransferase